MNAGEFFRVNISFFGIYNLSVSIYCFFRVGFCYAVCNITLNICINSQREIKHKLEGTRGGFLKEV